MNLTDSQPEPALTLETAVKAKYKWLLRWALHFVQNDRTAAEDLVQEAFVRLMLSWNRLNDLNNLEPLLYSYLRYAYLDELRRGHSASLQSLSTIDCESLAVGLVATTTFEQIEVQNELRSILSFLLWKRRTAKFASIFLLRFFHGYFPEEIAAMCRSTRHSVDLSLRHARSELKAYLLDAKADSQQSRTRLFESNLSCRVLPAHEFVDHLRDELVSNPGDMCFSAGTLQRSFHATPPRPLDCNLLAHIVTCKPCLEEATKACGVPSPTFRSIDDSLGGAPRAKQTLDPITSRISKKFRQIPVTAISAVTMSLVIVAGIALWIASSLSPRQRTFNVSLKQAIAAESTRESAPVRSGNQQGAIHQRVLIQAGNSKLQQDLYRDPGGHRKPRSHSIDKAELVLRQKLISANIDWGNPLSAASFQQWHDLQTHPTDQVRKTPSNTLVFTSSVNSGAVRSESLTVRAGDLHSIARTIVLENAETIEVAELSYEVLPWNANNSSHFDDLSIESPVESRSSRTIRPRLTTSFPTAPRLTDSEIDMATLSALLALRDLHAETERLKIVSHPNEITIEGVVEGDDRKRQILTRLAVVPNLKANISTYRELDENSALSSTVHEIKAVSVVSGESRLDTYCSTVHIVPAECRQISYRLLSSSSSLLNDSKSLSTLKEQFPQDKTLTTNAQLMLTELVSGHIDHMKSALWAEQQIIDKLTPDRRTEKTMSPAATDSLDNSPETNDIYIPGAVRSEDLCLLAQRNLSLTHAMVYDAQDESTTTPTLIKELAASLKSYRHAVSLLPGSSSFNSTTASDLTTSR